MNDALERLKALENDRADRKSKNQLVAEVDRGIDAAKLKLADLMRSSAKVQATVLKGIREKVKENQYRVSKRSI